MVSSQKIPLYHVVPFALDRSKAKKKKQKQKKKKKKKEKETDRGRDSLSDSRILPRFPGNDTDGTDHWEELLRADSARVRCGKKASEREREKRE